MNLEEEIARIVEEQDLSEEAEVFLDSIAFQFSQAGDLEIADLQAAAEISKRYSSPEQALQIIDSYIPRYIARFSNPANIMGSLSKLNNSEEVLAMTHKLNLRGLKDRIESQLLGISSYSPMRFVSASGIKDDTEPGFENAVRAYEG